MQKHRKHIRLRDYDYSQEGAYFITVCTENRKHFFCKNTPQFVPVWDPNTMLSPIGETITRFWNEIPDHFPHAVTDEFIVMPNHIHCILTIQGASHALADFPQKNQFSKPVAGSISVIIGQLKGAVKKWCNNNGHEYFNWQSKFHDHVIRDAQAYEKIKAYIINNPSAWNNDMFYT